MQSEVFLWWTKEPEGRTPMYGKLNCYHSEDSKVIWPEYITIVSLISLYTIYDIQLKGAYSIVRTKMDSNKEAYPVIQHFSKFNFTTFISIIYSFLSIRSTYQHDFVIEWNDALFSRNKNGMENLKAHDTCLLFTLLYYFVFPFVFVWKISTKRVFY